jgi:phospholipase/carboxylesterase
VPCQAAFASCALCDVEGGCHTSGVLTDLVEAGVGETAATIVALHHMGSGAGRLREVLEPLLDGLPAVRLVLPQADRPLGNGYSWFPQEYYSDPQVQAEELAQVVDGLADRLKAYAPFIVTGMSQGGDLSLAFALRHPDLVVAALPMLGMLPDEMLPAGAAEVPPLHLFHGEADPEVPIGRARRTAQALVELGAPVTLHTYPGVVHDIPEALLLDWRSDLATLLKAHGELGP